MQQSRIKCTLPSSHDFSFYSDLTSTAEDVEWKNVNPVEAMLGENGLVSKYGAELARDWYDVFLVKRVGNNTDVSIQEKKNLTGISYDVDETDVVTRIMPTGEDADGNILYLPELYIDSPNLNAYTHPKWIHLPVSEAKEVTDGDEPKSKAQCFVEMRKAAQAEFDGGCDLPTVTLKVDFVNCSDAEEYRQYAALTDIFLGDSVRVIARRIGVEVSMRMTQYTYDCLTRKYTSVTLGTAADTLEGSMISSRQLPSGVISGSKLAINSVGAGQLQSGSVGSLQVKMAAIQTAHIQDAAITKAKIAEATIGELNATAITAISAKIQELAAKNITTDELYAALATIAVAQITAANIEKANINWADIGELAAQIATIAQAQITTANIVQANIDWASIANLNAEIAKIAKAQITAANIESAAIDWAAIKDLNAAVAKIALAQLTTANINNAEIDRASIGQLQADIARLVNANIQTADIDWAQIKDLVAGTAIIEKGVNGKLYVADLAVTEANMASLTVGELIVKGADGCFYALSIAENGTVTTEKKSVSDADIGDNSISGGKLIEKTITARELNVASIFADEALVGAITAANIDVSSLFAAEAFIAQLNAVDISGNESLRLVVDAAKDEALDATGEAVAQIALTAEQIRSEVKRDYATSDQMSQVTETLSTLAEQSENNFTWTVTKVNEIIEDAAASDNLTREQLNLIHTYMRFGEDGLTIGKAGNPFFSESGLIAVGVEDECAWTPPVSLAAQIPNATSGWGTILCDTYVNGSLVSTNTCAFQLTVPASVVPSISNVAFSEATSGIADRFGGYVRTRSKLSISITAAGAQGSTVSAYRTSIDGVTYSGASFTTNTLNTAGNLTLTVTVTDSRGRTANTTRTVTVLDYSPPSLSQFTAERCNADGTSTTSRAS